jgi:hypothetical protein
MAHAAASLGYGSKNKLEENRYHEYLHKQSNGHTTRNAATQQVFERTLPEVSQVPRPRFATSLGYGRKSRGYNTYVFADAALEPPPVGVTEKEESDHPLPVGLGYGSKHKNYNSYLKTMLMNPPEAHEAGEVNPELVDHPHLSAGLGYGPWHKDYFYYLYAHDRKQEEPRPNASISHKDNLEDHLDGKLLPSALGYGPWHRDYAKFRDAHDRAPVLGPLEAVAAAQQDHAFKSAGGLGFGQTHDDHFKYLANYSVIEQHGTAPPVSLPSVPSPSSADSRSSRRQTQSLTQTKPMKHTMSTRRRYRNANRDVDNEPMAGAFQGQP